MIQWNGEREKEGKRTWKKWAMLEKTRSKIESLKSILKVFSDDLTEESYLQHTNNFRRFSESKHSTILRKKSFANVGEAHVGWIVSNVVHSQVRTLIRKRFRHTWSSLFPRTGSHRSLWIGCSAGRELSLLAENWLWLQCSTMKDGFFVNKPKRWCPEEEVCKTKNLKNKSFQFRITDLKKGWELTREM